MTVVFLEGLIISVLVLTRFREAVMDAVPLGLKRAISVGIGLFIAFIGFFAAGFVVKPSAGPLPVGLGSLTGLPMDRTALADGRIGDAFYRHWIRALNTLEDMPKIVLAVLHGYALGGGLQLALACRLATDDAVIGLGATRHGLIPDGAVLRLARVVGLGRAKELALLNDTVTSAEARSIGLVNWVCRAADVEPTVEALLSKGRNAAPTAVAHTKRLLHDSFHADPRSMIEALVEAQRECMSSWEIDEANHAWREQREAVFYPPPQGKGPA
jgi:enoyl-CoA hydratase/carnithine racemase